MSAAHDPGKQQHVDKKKTGDFFSPKDVVDDNWQRSQAYHLTPGMGMAAVHLLGQSLALIRAYPHCASLSNYAGTAHTFVSRLYRQFLAGKAELSYIRSAIALVRWAYRAYESVNAVIEYWEDTELLYQLIGDRRARIYAISRQIVRVVDPDHKTRLQHKIDALMIGQEVTIW